MLPEQLLWSAHRGPRCPGAEGLVHRKVRAAGRSFGRVPPAGAAPRYVPGSLHETRTAARSRRFRAEDFSPPHPAAIACHGSGGRQ